MEYIPNSTESVIQEIGSEIYTRDMIYELIDAHDDLEDI